MTVNEMMMSESLIFVWLYGRGARCRHSCFNILYAIYMDGVTREIKAKLGNVEGENWRFICR